MLFYEFPLKDGVMVNFAERLKALRRDKAVTQKSMAEYLGMREQAYQMYEYGKREPNHETTIKLADYFNVSLDYLVGRSANPEVAGYTRTKFAERLEILRIKKDVTKRTIAKYLEIHERTYQMYENDKREPSQEDLIKLANYFNVSSDYLLGISDKPERH